MIVFFIALAALGWGFFLYSLPAARRASAIDMGQKVLLWTNFAIALVATLLFFVAR